MKVHETHEFKSADLEQMTKSTDLSKDILRSDCSKQKNASPFSKIIIKYV